VNETEARALTQALHGLVSDPVIPLDLADRVELGYRRRQVLRVVLAISGVSVPVAVSLNRGNSTAPAASTSPGQSLQSVIERGRFTSSVRFDDGALTISPASGAPPVVTESQAIGLFRSTGVPDQLVSQVFVGYGNVTVDPRLSAGAASRLGNHPSWVVIYQPGRHGCPLMTARQSRSPEGRQVFILDASNGADAFVYREAGSWCGGPVAGPSITAAQQYVSLPWTLVSRDAGSLTVRYQASNCTGSTITARVLGAKPHQEAMVISGRLMQANGCTTSGTATIQVDLASAGDEVAHAPAGSVTGLYTDLKPTRFDFYDGNR
jgi:hypothetical protein